jgi:serine protease AprX
MKHSKRFFCYLSLILTATVLYSFSNNNSKISPELYQKTLYQNSGEKNLVWVFFKDKGPDSDILSVNPESILTKESIDRRNLRIKNNVKFHESDRPLHNDYVNDLKSTGIHIKQKTKWFNGVSCYLNKSEIELISNKDFVKMIDVVRVYNKNKEDLTLEDTEFEFDTNPNSTFDINYGNSINQAQLINVPAVHNIGFDGSGILIASLDAGFDNLQHPCFELIRSKGLRTYDFVNGDTIVADGPGRIGRGRHGTLTLSLACGFAPGFLVSPAFNSKYILAKTEIDGIEIRLEEDNWIAAAEWADSLGADIITSSLGYSGFDPPHASYTWEMMDGNTPLITRAADLAVSKGIVVVISAGNEGYNEFHNTLAAPADGDSVITVGSVNTSGFRADFSSVGPTADGRIKPDVMAMGTGVYTARFGAGNTGYTGIYTGTSLSCPMIAAVCALMLNANPDLSPIDVRNILRNTGSNNSAPNNLVGWGIVDALAAVKNSLAVDNIIPTEYQLLQNYPNPFNPSTKFKFNLSRSANVSIVIYDIKGVEVDRAIQNKFFPVGVSSFSYSNSNLSSGVYFYTMFANGVFIDSRKMILLR